MIKKILDFILPPACAVCRIQISYHPGLCAACWEKIYFISDPCCEKCGYPFPSKQDSSLFCIACLQSPPLYQQGRSALYYDELIKSLIMRYKYGDATHLISLFTQWLSATNRDLIEKSDIIVPVPLHWRRLLKRRYNQTALLALEISKKYQKTYIPHLLYCPRNIQPQGTKTKSERKKNVYGKFDMRYSNIDLIQNKTILLIDDVYASGATLNECVKVLSQHCSCNVNVLTLARVIH